MNVGSFAVPSPGISKNDHIIKMRSWQSGARFRLSPVTVEQPTAAHGRAPRCMYIHRRAQVIISVIRTSVSGHAGNTNLEYRFRTVEGMQYGQLPARAGNDCSTPASPILPRSPLSPVFPRLCSSLSRNSPRTIIKANALRSLANDFEKRFDMPCASPHAVCSHSRSIRMMNWIKPDSTVLQSLGISLFHASLHVIVSV